MLKMVIKGFVRNVKKSTNVKMNEQKKRKNLNKANESRR